MTDSERYDHIRAGKIILRPRRCPVKNTWHMSYYTNPNFKQWNWSQYDDEARCQDAIDSLVKLHPKSYISDK